MSFISLLRGARTTPAAILHKFLSQYDPRSSRVYAFVEGDSDEVFYEVHIRRHVAADAKIIILNCKGKGRVYNAYRDVVAKYPSCRRVLFFVDKDVDDYVGVSYSADPRIFTSEFYSVENYVISNSAAREYLKNFFKVRRVDFDIEVMVSHVAEQRIRFQQLLLPVMAWVICCRRAGGKVVLNDVDMDQLFEIRDAAVIRRKVSVVGYLSKFGDLTKCRIGQPSRDAILAMCRELKRVDARSFTRGHFEAWWFVKCVRSACAGAEQLAREAGGSVSYTVPLNESNFVQLLASTVETPESLRNFLVFHLAPQEEGKKHTSWISGRMEKILGVLR